MSEKWSKESTRHVIGTMIFILLASLMLGWEFGWKIGIAIFFILIVMTPQKQM